MNCTALHRFFVKIAEVKSWVRYIERRLLGRHTILELAWPPLLQPFVLGSENATVTWRMMSSFRVKAGKYDLTSRRAYQAGDQSVHRVNSYLFLETKQNIPL